MFKEDLDEEQINNFLKEFNNAVDKEKYINDIIKNTTYKVRDENAEKTIIENLMSNSNKKTVINAINIIENLDSNIKEQINNLPKNDK
jgi:ribosomal protein S8